MPVAKSPRGVIVWRCDSCNNVSGNPPVVWGFKGEAKENGCNHSLKKLRQFETANKLWWEDA